MPVSAQITGWGMAVPPKMMTNDELALTLESSDGWIRERTGIRQRFIAGPDQTTASLGTEAAIQALDVAGIGAGDVDLIILATTSPDYLLPATACLIQDRIGARKAGAFDLMAACSGFVYALNLGAQAVQSGSLETVLVVGAEIMSRLVDWRDRNTCILFGDGAGAFVMQAGEGPERVIAGLMRSDGSRSGDLIIHAGGCSMPASQETVRNGMHFIRMDGRKVYRFAIQAMAEGIGVILELAGLEVDEIGLIIPHQANARIIEGAARLADIPIEKFYINVDRYGNTGAASIPIAACEAVEKGRLVAGEKVIFFGFGAGLTWGASVVEWNSPGGQSGIAVELPANSLQNRSLYRKEDIHVFPNSGG